MRYAMIMAGGTGTRLWPVSRTNRPKQLLNFIRRPGDPRPRSLLELAADRLEGLIEPGRRYICTGEQYRQVIRRTLPRFDDEHILGEPIGRDTVNAIGLTASVLARSDPDAVFAVLTADHVIEPGDVFRDRLSLGLDLVQADPMRLVTFSITPTHPATGYGYVERGDPIAESSRVPGTEPSAFHVARFVEKPDIERARQYLASGRFGWNSGMFVFHARTLLDCLERFVPESFEGLGRIGAAWETPDRRRVLEEVYPTLPKISVDYAVMEPASNDDRVGIVMVEMPVRWLDVGSWPSYAQTIEPGEGGNRTAGPGRTLIHEGTDNLVYVDQPDHTVTLLGVQGLVVVHTADATLVMPADRAQNLKELHARLDAPLT